MLSETIIVFKFIKAVFYVIYDAARLKTTSIFQRYSYRPVESPKNIVIIGASFAGYYAAKLLVNSVPTGYRVVIVEKSSHFQFTWVFPRFSVIGGHEHKAFIPYGPWLSGAPEGSWLMMQDSVLEVGESAISLQSGEKLDYEYLVVATGSRANAPSRLNVNQKQDGVDLLQDIQSRIRNAKDFVVIGGGPAGVELASDAKSLYPEKQVTLVHSRKTLLNNFGTKLHDAAVATLGELGVRVVLGQRIGPHEEEDTRIALSSGETIPCDLLIRCTGQKAASEIIANLCPESISPAGGFLRVKESLQIANERFGNIFAAGDVAESTGPMNGLSAVQQARTVCENIIRAINGRQLVAHKANPLLEGGIELTLGMDKNVIYVTDGSRDMLINTKSKDVALKSKKCWKMMGAEPFLDDTWKG